MRLVGECGLRLVSDTSWLFELIDVPEAYLRHWRRTADLATGTLPSLPTAIHALEPRAPRAKLLGLATFLRSVSPNLNASLRLELTEIADEMEAIAES